MSAFDPKSVVVVAVAATCAISTGLWLNHAGGRGQVQAEAAVVETPAPVARPASVPTPARVTSPTSGLTQIPRSADGHYWAEARIDGRVVRVLVDTGASVVALTPEDALRLGLRLSPEDFTATVNTAGGSGRAARIKLASVSISGTEVRRVDAIVVEKGLEHSLLGMSYLGRLSSFEATPVGLTLRP